MFDETVHPTDEELLLWADGELSHRRAMRIRLHLQACWNCRTRMAETERTIGDFVKAHRESLDPKIPPIDGPRALLKMRLVEASLPPQGMHWWSLNSLLQPAAVMSICALTLFLAFAGSAMYRRSTALRVGSELTSELLPNRNLTPGATRVVGIAEICAMDHDEVNVPVSDTLRRQVFQEYGLRNVSADNYEVDYLVSPGLGGTDNIRNLWPQPRYSATWNSFVKDQLEDYLHRSVCARTVDLATAQRDVSTDWIAAYKKYFRTNEPIGVSTLNSRPLTFEAHQPL